MNEEKNEVIAANDAGEVAADFYENESGRAAAPAAEAAGSERGCSEVQSGTDICENTDEASGEDESALHPDSLDATPEASRGGAPDAASGDACEISDSDMRKIMSDPMFLGFAKGKSQDISTLCRDFCEMLKCGDGVKSRTNLDESVLMRVTPSTDGAIYQNVILTERQRMLAREAGMSYREYYDLISGIPEKK